MNDIRITLRNKGFIRQPDGSYSKVAPVAERLPYSQPKPALGHQPLEVDQDEKGGRSRVRLCVTRYATRLLDVDNLGGAKLVIDQLRYKGLIADDSPDHIDLELKQVKVASKSEEGTEIVISTEI